MNFSSFDHLLDVTNELLLKLLFGDKGCYEKS